MRKIQIALLFLAGLALVSTPALAQQTAALDRSAASVPDTWIVQSQGRELCRLRLTSRPGPPGGFRAEPSESCRPVIGDVAGWLPDADGLYFLAASGAPVMHLDRWSDSLFVSTIAGAPDVQLSRAPVGH